MQKCSSHVPVKRVLSVDWDYFVEANSFERFTYFPDGNSEYISPILSDFIWKSRYDCEKELKDFKIKKEYNQFRKLLKSINPNIPVIVTESHGDMYNYIKDLDSIFNIDNLKFDIDNIDFHHDIYNGKNILNCGNWLRILISELKTNIVTWIRHEDSDIPEPMPYIDTLHGINHLIDFNYVINKEYDALFLCKSRIWSPPHLDSRFISIVKLIKDRFINAKIYKEKGILKDRIKEIQKLSVYSKEEEDMLIYHNLFNKE